MNLQKDKTELKQWCKTATRTELFRKFEMLCPTNVANKYKDHMGKLQAVVTSELDKRGW